LQVLNSAKKMRNSSVCCRPFLRNEYFKYNMLDIIGCINHRQNNFCILPYCTVLRLRISYIIYVYSVDNMCAIIHVHVNNRKIFIYIKPPWQLQIREHQSYNYNSILLNNFCILPYCTVLRLRISYIIYVYSVDIMCAIIHVHVDNGKDFIYIKPPWQWQIREHQSYNYNSKLLSNCYILPYCTVLRLRICYIIYVDNGKIFIYVRKIFIYLVRKIFNCLIMLSERCSLISKPLTMIVWRTLFCRWKTVQ
jgi:hypothetical protein